MSSTTVDSNALPYQFEATTPPGDTFEKNWHFEYDLGDGTGPHDLPFTGCTLKLTVEANDRTVVIDERTITPTDIAGGDFTQRITAADSAAYAGIYHSKVVCVFPIGHIVFASGATKTLVLGTHEYASRMA